MRRQGTGYRARRRDRPRWARCIAPTLHQVRRVMEARDGLRAGGRLGFLAPGCLHLVEHGRCGCARRRDLCRRRLCALALRARLACWLRRWFWLWLRDCRDNSLRLCRPAILGHFLRCQPDIFRDDRRAGLVIRVALSCRTQRLRHLALRQTDRRSKLDEHSGRVFMVFAWGNQCTVSGLAEC